MFIRNIQRENIGPITEAGYMFTIPPGVSAIWDQAGELVTKRLFRIDSNETDITKRGAPLPPVYKAQKKDWKGQYVMVERFKLPSGRIPNTKDLINLAELRGVDKNKVQRWRADESVDREEIEKAINDLPVPDDIRFPEDFKPAESPPEEHDAEPESEPEPVV